MAHRDMPEFGAFSSRLSDAGAATPADAQRIGAEYARECRIAFEFWKARARRYNGYDPLLEEPSLSALNKRVGVGRLFAFRHFGEPHVVQGSQFGIQPLNDVQASVVAREVLRGDLAFEAHLEQKRAQKLTWDADHP